MLIIVSVKVVEFNEPWNMIKSNGSFTFSRLEQETRHGEKVYTKHLSVYLKPSTRL